MNSVIVVLAFSGTGLALIDQRYFYVSTCTLLIFKNIILVVSICRISDFIKTLDFASPNQKLMVIHYFNVTSYTFMYALATIFYMQFVKYEKVQDKLRENKNYVGFTICIGIQGIF